MSRRATRPRLLLLTPDFPPSRGGIQVLAHRLAAGMTGFETRVVAHGSPGADGFDRTSGLDTRRARSDARLGPLRHAPLNVRALGEALRFKPEVTLSAHIVTSPAAAVIRHALGAPTVQYFYAKEIPAKPRLAAFALRGADASIAISAYGRRLIAATRAKPAALELIAPGVDLPADPHRLPSDRPTFVTVARLQDRYKGHDVLVRALPLIRSRVPDVEWIVIGDGPLRAELERLARVHGVADRVRFLGAVSDDLRDGWLRRADLLAMPSRLPGGGRAGEGFGIVYLEAGAYGKPVVAGNVAGALDAVGDGETGLLVDPTDPEAVAEAISRLLLDRELARRMGEAGAERARRHAWPLIAQRVEAVLLESIADARPRRGDRRLLGRRPRSTPRAPA
jgi:phosphatidyl-myo-inositol dimannoside synthase